MKEKKKPGALTNLIFNIVIPVLIMTKLSKPEYLGPIYGLGIAIIFPLSFGIWEFIKLKDINFISVIGFISVLLTGILGLFQFNPFWIAVKEAAIPLVIGLVIVISELSNNPVIKKFLINDSIMEVELINEKLKEKNQVKNFDILLKRCSFFVSGSFFLSSIVNFIFARIIVVSKPGTVEYTEEIGKMTALHIPVVAIPSTIIMMIILFYIIKELKKLTNLEFEQIFKNK
jgi:hypothetical protein